MPYDEKAGRPNGPEQASLKQLDDVFRAGVDGTETAEYYVARGLIMIAAEIRMLRQLLGQILPR